MSLSVDARPHAVAIEELLATTVGDEQTVGETRVFNYGEVPGADGNEGTLPEIYVLVSVERRYNPLVRAPGRVGRTGWRVSVRSVGRTVNETRWAQRQVALALNEQRLLVASSRSTRMQLETPGSAEPDSGRYSALDTYTYAL